MISSSVTLAHLFGDSTVPYRSHLEREGAVTEGVSQALQ